MSAQGDSAVRSEANEWGSSWVTGPKRRACFSLSRDFYVIPVPTNPQRPFLTCRVLLHLQNSFSLVMLQKTSRSKISFPPCDEISPAETLFGILIANTTKTHHRKSLVSISSLWCHRIQSPNRNAPPFTAHNLSLC